MLKNTSSSYGLITRLFHWLISVAMITMIIVGFTMTSMAPSDDKWQLYGLHKASGVLVLALVFFRLLWRIINATVDLPSDLPGWQKLASNLTHYLLYMFMFLMPISGLLMASLGGHDINVFDLFTVSAFVKNIPVATFFHSIHVISAWGFSGLIALHICAGLYHHFIRRDNILVRMVRG